MKFKLLRLILIDSYCRGRVVELDLSGHITINGTNGAGKTTLLRLLPIFFGESPSKIIRGDAVTDSFGRYYFPTTGSYVIFEYQRRDQKALAVIHADGQSDGVVYRFIDSEFKLELFKQGDALIQPGELLRHLEKLNVPNSKPLSLHAYRNIIQNTTSRDQKNLAARYSFTGGTSKLTHIERVVTGILQKATSFYDLRRMIVSSILGEQQEFSLRISKKDLLHWVAEYKAHTAVMAKQPVMDDLEQQDHRRHMYEADFGRLHSRFKLLTDYHQNQVALAEQAEETAKDEHQQAETSYGNQLREIADKKGDADTAVRQAKHAIERIRHRKTEFENQNADEKVAKVEAIPGWETELGTLEKRYEELQKNVRSITEVFDGLANDARSQATTAKEKLEHGRTDAYKTAREKTGTLTASHSETLRVIRSRQEEEAEVVSQKVTDLKANEARLESEVRNAQPEQAAKDAVRLARDAVGGANDKLNALNERTAALQKAKDKAKGEFEELEGLILDGEQTLDKIQGRLDTLLAADNASEDTLLGFLRRNKPNWVSDIARIASEETLLRTDLTPSISSGSDLYGVTIDLEPLSVGQFASEEALQEAIKAERSRHEKKTAEISEDKTKLATKRAELEAANQSLSVHQASISTAKNAKGAADERLAAALRHEEESRKLAVARAESHLRACRADLQIAEDTKKALKARHADEIKRAEEAHARLLVDLNDALAVEIGKIDAGVAAIQADRDSKLAKITADKEESLKNEGVSPDVLRSYDLEIGKLKTKLNEANALRGQVIEYRDWLKNIWPTLPEKEREHQDATAEVARLNGLQSQVLQERKAVLDEKDAAKKKASELASKHSGLQRGASAQMSLLAAWPMDQEVLTAGFDSAMTLDLLGAERRRLTTELDACKEDIRKGVEEIRRSMCEVPDTGPERFYRSAFMSIGHVRQGSEHVWIGEFRTWFNDRHLENRNSVLQLGKTMAQSISTFWKALGDFKRDVSKFAAELKANLEQGKIFDAIADVTTDIKTHVDTQNYWTAIEALHWEYDAWHAMRDSALPPPSFVDAARTVATILSEEKALVADPVDLITLKISANVNDQGQKTANNEHELAHMSSNGLSYIILCVVLIAFVNRIRNKESVVIPFVVDELKDLSFTNAKTLLSLLERNNITMISAFPDVDLDLAELFGRNYNVLKNRSVGEIDIPDEEIEEAEVVNA